MSNYVYQELKTRLESQEFKDENMPRFKFNNSLDLIWDKITQANPGTKLDKNDYSFRLKEKEDGNWEVLLTLHNRDEIRKKYKNPDHEYRFDINVFDIKYWMDLLELPTVVNLKVEEYKNQSDHPIQEISKAIRSIFQDAFELVTFHSSTHLDKRLLLICSRTKRYQQHGYFGNGLGGLSDIFVVNQTKISNEDLKFEDVDVFNGNWDDGAAGYRPSEYLPRAAAIMWFVEDEDEKIEEETLDNTNLGLVRDDLTRNLSPKREDNAGSGGLSISPAEH